MNVQVLKVPMSSPNDLSGIEKLIQNETFDPNDLVAIMGKTEGNGCVNDFTRALATQSITCYFSKLLDLTPAQFENRVSIVMSGGTEGVLSPHFTLFIVNESERITTPRDVKRLSVAIEHTKDYLPEEIGTISQVLEVKNAVQRAIKKLSIENINDVHFVQIKCPLLTSERIQDAVRRGKSVVTEDTYESMAYSRGASALGVGVATGEVKLDQIDKNNILANHDLYSKVASTSAGIEVLHDVIIAMGNSRYATGKFVVGHDVMEDALDSEAIDRALGNSVPKKLINVFAKAEADPTGYIRGNRHTMLTDSDISHTRMARAVVGGALASKTKDTMIYVSGGAEHQGPSGGGPLAVIWEE